MKSKIRFWIPATILTLSLMFSLTNCTKDDGDTKGRDIPTVSTHEVTDITEKTAKSGGVISSDGGSTVTERGVCWSTNPTPTIADNKTTDGTGTGSYTSNLTSLTADTTYYVRAYATNSAGTGYGSTISFTTLNIILFNPNIAYGTMTDIDGNTYKTVTIGPIPSVSQTWMAENLKVTRYNDGTNIPNVTDAEAWSNLTSGAFCEYNNIPSKSETYGKLYNWYAVNTGRLCPDGWHVPSDAEWDVLINNVGGEDVAGGKLKEIGTNKWYSPNTGATNESGFTALPGGELWVHTFLGHRYFAKFWSSSPYDIDDARAWHRTLLYDYNFVLRGQDYKVSGSSIRCVRD